MSSKKIIDETDIGLIELQRFTERGPNVKNINAKNR